MKYYYADVERITGFGKSYVNFLISVSKLCQEYPKLMFVTMTTDDINNKIGLPYLRERIAHDAMFWKQV